MNIITLTPNPSFDIHWYTEHFAPYHENLAEITQILASGKGVNISRALAACGVDNLPFAILGADNAERFRKNLGDAGIVCRGIVVPGQIRENFTLHTADAPETRISFSGFPTDNSLLPRMESAIADDITENTMITFTGRVPPGMTMPAVKDFLRSLVARGARIVIDSKSFTLDDLLELKPWLIKPNQEEIGEYLGREIESFEEVVPAAKELHDAGIANVMVSLGALGALLVCKEGTFVATPPVCQPVSTIGAGDSTIAGFLAAASEGRNADECLVRAVSYGSAACLTEGTLPPRPEDVNRLLPDVTLKKID